MPSPRICAKACATAPADRFTTVLGPGSDGYHEAHIHLDLAERRQWLSACANGMCASRRRPKLPRPDTLADAAAGHTGDAVNR